MSNMILILEDDAERIQQFRASIATITNPPELRIWKSAFEMREQASEWLPSAKVISLDHDLISEPGTPDPGDGYTIAQWLTSQPHQCPVIIHSSNGERVRWMVGEFELSGWEYHRVLPFEDDWIQSWWLPTVRNLLDLPG